MLTPQQQTIIDKVKTLDSEILLVRSAAGTGKTSTALAIVDAVKPARGLYTAFNKAIIVEGASKFTSNINCKTLHALALSYVRPKLKIEDFTYTCFKEKLTYSDRKEIIDAMDEFFRSASLDMYEFLSDCLTAPLAEIAANYIEGMIADTVHPTFNFLLKYFHVLLATEAIAVNYDIVILDEIQDTTAVSLEIFKLIHSPKKIGLGDPEQAIYGFMNLVDGFEVLADSPVLSLTKSFRCSSKIASDVERFVRQNIKADFEFIGIDNPIEDGLTAYITATNAQIVLRIHQLHLEGKGYTLTRSVTEIFACILALSNASRGKPIYHKKYKFLEKEYKNYTLSGYKSFFAYLKQKVDDPEVNNSIDVLMRFSKSNISPFQVFKEAKSAKKNPAITVGTAFSLKGLGFSTVYIEDDLNSAVTTVLEAGGPESDADATKLKLYYVACTRARIHLHNAIHLIERKV